MKNLILFLSFLLFFSTFASELKILTFNIHCMKDDWKFRLEKISDYLASSSPEFIFLQEVCSQKGGEDQILFLKKKLQEKGYPLLQIEAQFTHIAWDIYEEYIVSFSKVQANKVQKGLLPRSPLERGYIGMNYNGDWFINTHLEFHENYYYHRERQIKFLIDNFSRTSHIILGQIAGILGNSLPR